ncbi:hypothetical protein HNQ77_001670 [Silvibacterium bohemicum]|uniref:Aminoglycoside phosphotransferase domain-containing protein n=1 Tax=Silvibacterium bohemicum TaxID=1577686 RepID=A0A841JXK6_9BACT|nr:phosphotransferase [Silvibacterium bohemicum]MBB6143721.1 hypothetical protein [Silvibacterium bohemicum]
MADHMEYRLALLLPESRQVLGFQGFGADELPRISIPRWERPAEQLTKLVEEMWHVKSVVLDVLIDASSPTPFAIMEVRKRSSELERGGLRPVQPDDISNASLGEKERHAVASILSNNADDRGPFARIGWVGEVQEWIQREVHSRDIRFSEDILQFNAGGGFSLVRFDTQQGSAYWLKAVGNPNEHEFRVTTTLATLFKSYLPPIVAVRPEWNAWVMEDAGQPLSNSFDLPSVEKAVTCLAELQGKSVDCIETLLAAGCPDCSIPVLADHLRALTEYLGDAMNRQTSTKAPRLEIQRLRELESIVRDACLAMQDLRVPDALIHNDINGGNILLCGSRCVFTDWAEACIGNPFLTFQHLCAQVSLDSRDAEAWLPCVRSAYKRSWREWLTESQIDQAFVLMPILAIASYLYGRGAWLNSPIRETPHFQSYSRSLARHMDRAARAPELLEALCR